MLLLEWGLMLVEWSGCAVGGVGSDVSRVEWMCCWWSGVCCYWNGVCCFFGIFETYVDGYIPVHIFMPLCLKFYFHPKLMLFTYKMHPL